jgi:hypothetical protein
MESNGGGAPNKDAYQRSFFMTVGFMTVGFMTVGMMHAR